MTTLDPQAKLKIKIAYAGKHSYEAPSYVLDQCAMHMASSADGLTKVFVFAQQKLPLETEILAANLKLLPIKALYDSYLLNDFSKASAPVAVSTPDSVHSKRSYQPDALDPDAYKKFMRNLC